ncbi:MAG TPA: hypothetical protein ENI89_07485 [Desulfobulbus sp.]|nr:hypothetical protein [Desulfobulbus sp.]
MKKIAFAVALAFGLSLAVSAMASSVKCTVTEIKGTTVTLDCGHKASRLVKGEAVKVKSAKRKAIEGC